MLDSVEHLLGPEPKLSSLNARSVDPHSGAAQPLHVDMDALPDARGNWVANVIWMLDDFTPENGATRAIPGVASGGARRRQSHRCRHQARHGPPFSSPLPFGPARSPRRLPSW